MPYPPRDYNICPCCGIEYGLEDAFETYDELRDEWLLAGGPWFSEAKPYVRPANWNAWEQLDLAGYKYNVPRPVGAVQTEIVSSNIPAGFKLIETIRNTEWIVF